MAKKKVSTNLVIVLLVLVGLLGYTLLVQAGSLEPTAAPAPTMKTLQEVYDAASAGINEREGFCQYFETPADSNQVMLTVPTGKRFVILKLHTTGYSLHSPTKWRVTVNNETLINGKIVYGGHHGGGVTQNNTHDFPDRCVTVNEGDTLKFVNDEEVGCTIYTTIIGYYYDIP